MDHARSGAAVLVAAVLLAAACSRNPVIGDWELDRGETARGAVAAAELTGLVTLRFESDAIVAPGTRIPVTYAREGEVVRAVRGDGRGEHRVELLPDGRLRVDLPIGVTAVYKRAGS
jgi:hypothetical protein